MRSFVSLLLGWLLVSIARSAFSRGVDGALHQPLYDRVCITCQETNDREYDDSFLSDIAQQRARDLGVQFYSMQDEIACDFSCSHVIDVIPFNVDKTMTYALGIRKLPEDSRPDSQRQRSLKSLIRKAGSPSPFIVDFCPTNNSRLARRSVGGGGGTDMLVKAVGPKKEVGGAIVYDLTAGFGQDSLVLLQNGASSVTMVERDPIVAALLQDAYRRLKLSTDALAIELSERMKISVGDSAEILKILTPDTHPHICYLDPMFPLRTKSSAVKKNMQILHSLLGTQEAPGDSETQQNDTTLLDAALEIARKRVVVKRPINGRPLLSSRGVMPSFDFRGSVNRFDVYITA